jgi:orotate phosphoribosyltransferase
MAYPISMLTGIPLLYVRKEQENSHGIPIEGSRNADVKKFAIIDDLIASGTTVNGIIEKLKAKDETLECVCIMLYNNNSRYNPTGCPIHNVNEGTVILPEKTA